MTSTPLAVTRVEGRSPMLICALIIILALSVGVGLVSHTILHHIVQTLPLWVVVFLGRRPAAKWFGVPCFVFWLVIMVLIWLFLLHLPSPLHGHFSPMEITMTIVVGVASVIALASAALLRGVRPGSAAVAFLLGAAAQYACFWISKIPAIWNH